MTIDSRTVRLALTCAMVWAVMASPLALPADTAANQTAAPLVAADRARYFASGELQDVWRDLEAQQVINKRIVEGGSYSINVRTVKSTDAPLVHLSSADVWLVTAGSATAVTGGELVNPAKRPNGDDTAGSAIRNGTDQPLKAGDVLFVPPGVPHGFKDLKGFHALLIRFEVPASKGSP
jgi:mannose-6-phosphate isomerase-like protein (cupin superfamily)